MNIRILRNIGLAIIGFFVVLYVLFLILPLIANPIIKGFIPQIIEETKKATGLVLKLDDIRLQTTPKLTAGVKIQNCELLTPNDESILNAKNLSAKMSLLPLFRKKIQADIIKADDIKITIRFTPYGTLYIEEYLPQTEENKESEAFEMPFGLKLSNHLPDMIVNKYSINLTDGFDNYIISGENTKITDFIFNKSIKIKGSGHAVFKGKELFKYDVKVFNKIMPDIDLQDFIFNPQEDEQIKAQTNQNVDIIGVLKGLYYNNVTANANINIKTEPDNYSGNIDITNVSIINLPPSNAHFKFSGQNIDIKSDIYSAQGEASKINGSIKTGKNPDINMYFKSQAQLSNIIKIVKDIAVIFNIKDLQTLSANGKIDADFNIKSDLKTVKSNGHLKIPSANLYYGLYKVGVDNINADIKLNNNNININNIGFSIFNQPLRFYGTISEKADCDLHLVANKLSLKGLLVAFGQAAILKENPVNSGTITMNVDIKGALDKINPTAKIIAENVDLKNIPTDIRLKAPLTNINIISDGKTFSGTAVSDNIKAINPAATVSVPKLNANIKPEEIEIAPANVYIEKIKAIVSGKITNYLTEKVDLNFTSSGDIKSALTGQMNLNKQTLNLNYATTQTSTIIVPMFDKSKMTFKGNIDITGSMLNPIIKGNAFVSSLTIPEIPVEMKNMDIKLDGPIFNGNATVKEFASGGITADSITTDFSLKGVNFYLNNLKGNSFDGKIKGNIIYNLSNAKTTIDFSGDNMNAEKAVAGAIGIKKALYGTLSFKTKLTLLALDYEKMMKSMKGNLDFEIKKGSFGTIGKFEYFLNASNIINNVLLKNTVSAISNATGLVSTTNFEDIKGEMTFDNGWANLKSIKSRGSAVCYFITGKYNLINGTTNVTVLGRLDAQIVSKLGPIGELSADKVLGYIPKFGEYTAKAFNALTTNPNGENIAAIPALSNGSKNYKDFKVTFNGGLESKSSVKSFKWLSNPDMTGLEKQSIKDTLSTIKSAAKTDVKTTVESVNQVIDTNKQMITNTKENIKNSKDEIKNLFKSIKQIPSAASTKTETTQSESAPATETKQTENSTSTETVQETTASGE